MHRFFRFIIRWCYIILRKIFLTSYMWITRFIFKIKLIANDVKYGENLICNGLPYISVKKTGILSFGRNVTINNGNQFNRIGRNQNCIFSVSKGAKCKIGNNVGLSSTAIVCTSQIILEDYVQIGGGTVIYDTDFHNIQPDMRINESQNLENIVRKPVFIKKNAFIGAHSIILKGVIIGENSIIGTGSVVTKSVPDNEVWAGNPACFIKKL
jgi:acetyltransferase-like isoleucine patch superfamily enzyme